MADGAVLRKLLGRPSKTKTLSSCMTGISKDLKLTYANIFVQLERRQLAEKSYMVFRHDKISGRE